MPLTQNGVIGDWFFYSSTLVVQEKINLIINSVFFWFLLRPMSQYIASFFESPGGSLWPDHDHVNSPL